MARIKQSPKGRTTLNSALSTDVRSNTRGPPRKEKSVAESVIGRRAKEMKAEKAKKAKKAKRVVNPEKKKTEKVEVEKKKRKGEAMSSEAAEDDLGSYLVPALSLQTSGTPLALPPRQRAPDVECAIFWDYESIELPSQLVGAEASNRLREVALRFGRLVERRLYHDPQKITIASR